MIERNRTETQEDAASPRVPCGCVSDLSTAAAAALASIDRQQLKLPLNPRRKTRIYEQCRRRSFTSASLADNWLIKRRILRSLCSSLNTNVRLKPRPHQQQCRSNIVECYKLNDSFDKIERCFDIVAGVDGALTCHAQRKEVCLDQVDLHWLHFTVMISP